MGKITSLAALTATATDDLLLIVDDPSGSPVSKKITVANLVALKADNRKLYFGEGSDASLYYDGTDLYAKTNEVAASDLVLVTGAAKTLKLDTLVWDDIRITPAAFDFPGASDPVLGNWQPGGSGATFKVWAFDANDEAFFTIQLPHSYAQGEDITAHVHWTPRTRGTTEATATVAWKLDYSWANINGTFGASATADMTDACQSTNHHHLITPNATITGTGKTISSMLVCRIYRDAGDSWAGSGATNAPALLEVDLHYPMDTIGSRQAGSK